MTKKEIYEAIKNNPNASLHKELFTKNIFGETIPIKGRSLEVTDGKIQVFSDGTEDAFEDSFATDNTAFERLQSKTTTTPATTTTDAPAIGNSIFKFEQEQGTNSELGNWAGRKYFGEEVGNGGFGSGSLPSISLECSKLTYLPVNVDVLLKFNVSGKNEKDWGGGYDIEIVSSNKSIILSSKKFSIEKGWTFLTNIKSTTTGKVSLQVKVDGILKNTFEFVFLDSKDVFQKDKVDKLIGELKYIQDFAEQELAPEYDENYCMQAAERGLSELLNEA
ncbi:MAG: hypothetical protein JST62_03455 [Bacteroidetes bacterium]|jgi:hypothetical protein|nr:hypothetical protein [Bacteroidota bacterium]